MDFINRHAKKTIERMANSYPAVLVTGARQTGKTTLLQKSIESKNIQYLTFDDPIEEFSSQLKSKHVISNNAKNFDRIFIIRGFYFYNV